MVVGAWWWRGRNAEQLKESAKASYLEGQRAGAALNESGCLTRAIARHKDAENQTFVESIRTNLNLRGCLDASKADPKFCDGVPAKDDVLSLVAWVAQSCANLGFTDSYCGQLMTQISEYCSSQNRTSKL